jgi:hypothetical protein
MPLKLFILKIWKEKFEEREILIHTLGAQKHTDLL